MREWGTAVRRQSRVLTASVSTMGRRHPGDPTARRETVTAREAAVSTAATSAAQACRARAMRGRGKWAGPLLAQWSGSPCPQQKGTVKEGVWGSVSPPGRHPHLCHVRLL